MHEMSIAQSMIEIVKEEMVKNNASSLRSVRLNIGLMSSIVPDALSFCFEIITSNTDLEGAKLFIDLVPMRVYCHTCEQEFEIKDHTFSCVSCGGANIETISGRELSITEIEVY